MSGGHHWDVLGNCVNRLLSTSLGWLRARLAAAQNYCCCGAAASLARGFGKFCLGFWGGGTQLQQSGLANFSTPEGSIVQEELVNSLLPKVILLGQTKGFKQRVSVRKLALAVLTEALVW